MASCPRCGRSVPASRPTCLYCGAPLPVADGAPRSSDVDEDAPEEAPDSGRVLVIVRVSPEVVEPLARALGTTLFEAVQLSKRGDYHLLRIAAAHEAEAEAARLGAAGLSVVPVPEREVLACRPRFVLGGTMTREALRLRTEADEAEITAAEVLLVVQGPITRHYQTSSEVKRVRTATLAEGYRIHLHPKAAQRPLEIDPGGFEFGRPGAAGSSLLEIRHWIASLARAAPVDDSFRRLTPALGPSAGQTAGVLGAVESLSPRLARSEEGPPILDNLRQFRFYSCWRAAVERRAR